MPTATRDPASHRRLLFEGAAAATPAGLVAAYFISSWFPDMPEMVLQAIVGLIVTGGALLMSHVRNCRHQGKGVLSTSLVMLSVFTVALLPGCASYDGAKYHKIASAEIAALGQSPATLTIERCEAQKAAAEALQNDDGKASAFKGPLGSGSEMEPTIRRHRRQNVICLKLLELLTQGEASQQAIDRAFKAWQTQFQAGDDLFGEE